MKDINYHLSLPYTKIATKREDEDGTHYTSHVLELRGCMSDGETKQQALENLQEALECYLESRIAHNDDIPEPLQVATA
ncbi:MAG: type II toxin-antitoxin system HicB family antitoxin [Defluviitaleaceae bacterium]|nr:type II toxin-antitoxin system HicB family antitoxin [Defluviitaleaceae bacterium]